MKFLKQNYQSARISGISLEYCDPITSDNIVDFVKQRQSLLPLREVESGEFRISDLEPALRWVSSKTSVGSFLRSSAYSRFSHSSDWKEIRYLEKADVGAMITSLFPIIIWLQHMDWTRIHRSSVGWAVCCMFRNYDTHEGPFHPSMEILSMLMNIWLFHPDIQQLAQLAREAYGESLLSDDCLSLAVTNMYARFMEIIMNTVFDIEEVRKWIRNND